MTSRLFEDVEPDTAEPEEWETLLAKFICANDDLRTDERSIRDRRQELTPDQWREKTRQWWRSFSFLADRGINLLAGDEGTSQFAFALRKIEHLARDLAKGRIPPLIKDVTANAPGYVGPDSLERDLDYATCYLIACKPPGFSNRFGHLRVTDKAPNRTIAWWFGVSYDTARSFRRRTMVHEVPHSGDGIVFAELVKRVGDNYSEYGRRQ